jgi:hypothetical protein
VTRRLLLIWIAIASAGSMLASPSAAAAVGPTATVGPFTFAAEPFTFRAPTFDPLGYDHASVVPLIDTKDHDAAGVRLFRYNGVLYDHPVAQAQYALQLIHAYEVTGNATYLTRAVANAQRLRDRSLLTGGARFYPYPFDFALHGDASDTIRHPWYSAMAQGLALAMFVRLSQVTHRRLWRATADETYRSFLVVPKTGQPWASRVDANGLLWFEEYAGNTPPDQTYNGHLFATLGLVYYARMSRSSDAWNLVRGGLTTALRLVPSIRNAGWVSNYCLSHGAPSAGYHAIHIFELSSAYTLTADLRFAQAVDQLNSDYPAPVISGTVRLPAAKITGYHFASNGAITGTKTATLTRASSAPASRRIRIANQPGIWLLITAGLWAGYYVRETASIYVYGRVDTLTYDPARIVALAPGTYVGRKYGTNATLVGTKTITLTTSSSALANQWAIIDGKPMAAITNGALAGYWVTLQGGATFAAAPAAATAAAPAAAPKLTPSPSTTPTATTTPITTASPTPTPTPTSTSTPSPTHSPAPTPTPAPTPSPSPSSSPTPPPSSSPTPDVTASPTPETVPSPTAS